MASGIGGPVPEGLETLFDGGTTAGLSDRDLLARFSSAGKAAAEVAFATLVERHGPMVLRVCRDVLRDPHDAEDAFQAAFLVLARQAGSIRKGDSIGPWLHGVALRVAGCARAAAARRRRHERRGASRVDGHTTMEIQPDLGPELHEEVGRLPEHYRSAVVLCYLEGLTHEQAAGQLGWPVGTVRSRLAWAREKLRARLTRRGLAPSAAALGGSSLAEGTAVVVPTALFRTTVQLAIHAAEAGAVPAAVAALAGRTLRIMLMTNVKWLTTGLVAAGLASSIRVGMVVARQEPATKATARPAEKPTMPRTVGEKGDQARDNSYPNVPTLAEGARSSGRTSSISESSHVLWVRLKAAYRSYQSVEKLFKRGEISQADFQTAQEEVEVLAIELESLQEELLEEVDRLRADLAVKQAIVDVAQAEVDQAILEVERTRWGISDSNKEIRRAAEGAKASLSISKANHRVKEAEANVVKLRLHQVDKRWRQVKPLAIDAKALVPKGATTPASPPPPASPK